MPGRSLFEQLKNEGWRVVDELVAERATESLHLEFKTKALAGPAGKLHDDDRKNLAKTISAFANTEGGCVIFGINTDRGKGDSPDQAKSLQLIDDLARFAGSVEAILKDVTNPAVPGVELLRIEEVQGSTHGVLAIYIPQSVGGPHRAGIGPGDVREHYYQRSASRTDIMPHAILAALMGRVPTAMLQLRLKLWSDRASKLHFSLELGNLGRGSARQPAIRFFEVNPDHRSFLNEMIATSGLADGWTSKANVKHGEEGDVFLTSTRDVLIYPGDRVVLTEQPGGVPGGYHWGGPVDFPMKGVIYAADARPVEFHKRIKIGAIRDPPITFDLPQTPTE